MFLSRFDNKIDPETETGAVSADHFRKLRRLLHNRLIDSLEDEGIHALRDNALVGQRLNELIDEYSFNHSSKLSELDRKRLVKDVIEELSGMGPIANLMLEPGITDILINGPYEIWVDQKGRLKKTDLQFDDDEHLRRFLDRIVGVQGRQIDARQPMVDTKLADGSRLHAVIPPLCAKGAVVSIRRFHSEKLDTETLVNTGFLSADMLRFLEIIVAAGTNTIIAGSAGAGKTSLLNAIAGYVSANERIVTVEETAELRLNHPHVIPLETRHVNTEGIGSVTLRDLVRTALRMRADRIIVGEVRSGEVLDMLQAMNVGHDGSLTTLHANSPQDAVNRLEALALMGNSGLTRATVRHMIGSSVQLIVQVMRFRDGSRRVVSICELIWNHGSDSYEVRELFHFKQTGEDSDGMIAGEHIANGNISYLADSVELKGFDIDEFNALLRNKLP